MSAEHLSSLIADYDFELPEELIAQTPASARSEARLLVARRHPERGLPAIEDLQVKDLPELLRTEPALKNSLWVRNRTRVIPARFYAKRPTGSRHEIVLLEEESPGRWRAIIRGVNSFKYPQTLHPETEPALSFTSPEPGLLDFTSWKEPVRDFLERVGEMPLPPYIRSRIPSRDKERYQSIWAAPQKAESVAAPTASLHFTPELCAAMEREGASFTDLYLHVGLGTFEPVRVERLENHKLHEERFEVPAATKAELISAISQKKPLVAVGTTALRTLEGLPWMGEPLSPLVKMQTHPDGSWSGRTGFFIRPGLECRYARALFTNFHLPQSTLLVLVATFTGSWKWVQEVYKHAVDHKYRFFSYGDSSLWL